MTDRAYFSHSKLLTFLRCRKEYWHKYVKRAYPIKRPTYFVYGSAGHLFLEHFYNLGGQNLEVAVQAAKNEFAEVDRGLMTPDDIHNLECDMASLLGICDAYVEAYASDLERFESRLLEQDCLKEKGICLDPDFKGYQLYYEGKLDALFQDAAKDWWVFETKFLRTFTESMVAPLHIDRQVLGYMHLAKKVLGHFPRGVIYNVVKKPGIRLKKGESKAQFQTRCRNYYQEKGLTEGFFIRKQFDVSEEHLEDWKTETIATMRQALAATKRSNQVWVKSTGNCAGKFGSPCTYLTACRDKKHNKMLYKVSE